MMKKIILSLVLALTIVHAGCTSGDSKSEDVTLEDSLSGEDSEVEGTDAIALEGDEAVEGGDAISADLGDESAVETLPDEPLDVAANSEAPAEPPPAADIPADPLGEMSNEPPASDSMAALDSGVTPDAGSTPVETPPPAPKASLKKIKDEPFTAADGTLLNAVYVARKGDTMKSASELIYNADRSGDLKRWNPTLKKNLKVGDKVYYNSPQRPTDSSRVAVYFEDVGAAPQVHTTSEGDDLKKLGKQLLGHKDSWKELWVTNPNLDSKGQLSAGLEIRYWPQEATASAMTQETPAPPAEPVLPPAPSADAPAVADIPPPPPMPEEMAGQGSLEPPSLPPPPPPSMTPPKPPRTAEGDEEPAAMDQDMLLIMGVGAATVLGLIMLIVIRKRRAKNMDFTQV